MQHLGRLLLIGYALAAAGGALVHGAGYGLLSAVAVFWLGGAMAVAILAVLATPFLAARPDATAAEDAALADALQMWEADRLADRAGAPPAAGHVGSKAGR